MKKTAPLVIALLFASSCLAEEGQSKIEPLHLAQSQPKFKCDGRKYCNQMRSCAEAKYFLKHCPNTKMDGDGDGVPCEKQWCGHSH